MNKKALLLARASHNNIEALMLDRRNLVFKHNEALERIDRKITNYNAQLAAALEAAGQEGE